MNRILSTSLLSAAVLLLLFTGLAYAGGDSNPFLTPKKETTSSAATGDRTGSSEIRTNARTGTSGSLYTAIMTRITMAQKEIRDRLTGFATEIRKNHFGKSFWLFLAFTFAYGAVHALGPGHGKSVVCAYFISRPGSMLTAAFMSWLISIVHVGSATVTVCLAYLLLKNGMSGFESFNNHMQTASFLLITAIGLWMTVEAVFSFRGRDCGCANARGATLRETAAVALVTGIIPCPGAAIILVYTLSAGILPAGIAAMVCMAAGMGITTSLFAIAATGTRRTMERADFSGKIKNTYSILSLSGGLVILGFGTMMLAAHLG